MTPFSRDLYKPAKRYNLSHRRYHHFIKTFVMFSLIPKLKSFQNYLQKLVFGLWKMEKLKNFTKYFNFEFRELVLIILGDNSKITYRKNKIFCHHYSLFTEFARYFKAKPYNLIKSSTILPLKRCVLFEQLLDPFQRLDVFYNLPFFFFQIQ